MRSRDGGACPAGKFQVGTLAWRRKGTCGGGCGGQRSQRMPDVSPPAIDPDVPTPGRRAWVWPLGLAAAIFLASSQSRIAAPNISNVDKIGHFLVYAWLALLLVRCPRNGARQSIGFWGAVVLASLYGISDEIHQGFTPGRSIELADWVADTLGATAGAGIYVKSARFRRWLEMSVRRRG